MESHLLQMRGLKPLFKGAFERVFNVASFTGTTIYNIFCKKITGLKYLFVSNKSNLSKIVYIMI